MQISPRSPPYLEGTREQEQQQQEQKGRGPSSPKSGTKSPAGNFPFLDKLVRQKLIVEQPAKEDAASSTASSSDDQGQAAPASKGAAVRLGRSPVAAAAAAALTNGLYKKKKEPSVNDAKGKNASHHSNGYGILGGSTSSSSFASSDVSVSKELNTIGAVRASPAQPPQSPLSGPQSSMSTLTHTDATAYNDDTATSTTGGVSAFSKVVPLARRSSSSSLSLQPFAEHSRPPSKKYIGSHLPVEKSQGGGKDESVNSVSPTLKEALAVPLMTRVENLNFRSAARGPVDSTSPTLKEAAAVSLMSRVENMNLISDGSKISPEKWERENAAEAVGQKQEGVVAAAALATKHAASAASSTSRVSSTENSSRVPSRDSPTLKEAMGVSLMSRVKHMRLSSNAPKISPEEWENKTDAKQNDKKKEVLGTAPLRKPQNLQNPRPEGKGQAEKEEEEKEEEEEEKE